MTGYSWKALLSVALVQIFVKAVSAYDYCGQLNGLSWYCYDKGSSIAYCCRHDSIAWYCCYYTAIWGLWYFWIGIVVLVSLFATCIGAYKRQRTRRQLQNANVQVATVRTAAVNTVYPTAQGNPGFASKNDFPPSYNQLPPQGFSSQFNAETKTSTGVSYPQQSFQPTMHSS